MTLNLIGNRYGTLVVIDREANDSSRHAKWICLCDCGVINAVRGDVLRRGVVRCCKCKSVTHGNSGDRLYHIWQGMKDRCHNMAGDHYWNYGARGIRVCDDWLRWENFKDWAEEHGYEENLTIDRINNDGNYEPDNCQWLTREANSSKGGA
jgi:hypothetical protein